MGAGQLRESVTFQRRGSNDDGRGNQTTGSFANITGCVGIPANMKPTRQGEIVAPAGVQPRTSWEVTVRDVPALRGVTVGDQMIDARDTSRTFNVKSAPVNTDQHRKYLKILVEEGGASG